MFHFLNLNFIFLNLTLFLVGILFLLFKQRRNRFKTENLCSIQIYPKEKLKEIDSLTPISFPLNSISCLDSWKASRLNSWNQCLVPLRQRPNVGGMNHLVCHDMAGGYKEDKNVFGSFFPKISDDSQIRYTFQNWNLVDTFVYFSHERIGIPPSCWTAAAHRNGVKVLGTLITEGENGRKENVQLVKGPTISKTTWSPHYADKLVEVAKYYGFDGWFFNIESSISGSSCTSQDMAQFLSYLRDKLHQEIPGSLLVWYDSLTSNGYVRWQNCLNQNNKMFFDVTDQFFTNYWWNQNLLTVSRQYAKERNNDVLMGMDVWGRGTYSGGGLNAYKALSLVKKNLLGFATFAPAWTYERRSKDEFLKLDRLFWCGTSNSKEIGVSKYMEDRSRPSADYFYSNFNQGYGYGLWFEGRKMLSGFWHHIGLQSVVPSLHLSESFVYSDKFQKDLIDVPEFTGLSWKVSTDCSFNGGSSIQIECKNIEVILDTSVKYIRSALFQLSHQLNSGDTIKSHILRKSTDTKIGFYWKKAENNVCTYIFESANSKENEWVAFEYLHSGPSCLVSELGICIMLSSDSGIISSSQDFGFLGDMAIVTPYVRRSDPIDITIVNILSSIEYAAVDWSVGISDKLKIYCYLLFEEDRVLGVSLLGSYSFLKEKNPCVHIVKIIPVDVIGNVLYNSSKSFKIIF